MAPEQCVDSHAVDGRADIYSLGCTLYELLTGRPPFAGPNHGSVFLKMKAHVEAPVPPIQERCPDVPDRLAAALERMLAKDPSGRFVSAAGVAAALQRFATGAGMASLPLTPPPRGSGKKAGSRTGPLALSRACFRTLCSSRTLPGHE